MYIGTIKRPDPVELRLGLSKVNRERFCRSFRHTGTSRGGAGISEVQNRVSRPEFGQGRGSGKPDESLEIRGETFPNRGEEKIATPDGEVLDGLGLHTLECQSEFAH